MKMNRKHHIVSAVIGLVLIICSTGAAAAGVTGEAQAVISELLGSRTVFADTGTLISDTDSRHKSLHKGEIQSLVGVGGLTGEVMHATTTAGVDQVDSTASLGDLIIDIGGISTVSVEFVRAEARAEPGGYSSGNTEISSLTIGGSPVSISGEINQVILLLSGSIIPLEIGRIVINEHQSIPGGIKVNGLHVIVYGVGDVIIASTTAAFP